MAQPCFKELMDWYIQEMGGNFCGSEIKITLFIGN
jgi:hypothetical protein